MRIPERERCRAIHETKEHGEREFPFNIYPCAIPGNFPLVPVHWHQEMEMIVIKRGVGLVTVDKEPWCLEAGELIAVFPGQLHGIGPGELGESVEYENIIFRLSMLAAPGGDWCTARFLRPWEEQGALGPFAARRGMPGWEEIMDCVMRLDRLSERRDFGYQLGVKGILLELLGLIAAAGGGEVLERPRRSRERIKGLLDYVEEHCGEEISVEQAAGLCCYSKSHFMKYFKQYMGISFIQYLNDCRLDRAAGLLVSTQEAVTEVAGRCGFENLSYFNRLFRRRYGTHPGDYRRRGVKKKGEEE